MSTYRYDELTGAWVAVASERHGLPIDVRVAAEAAGPPPDGARPCPFCPGHESETEATVAAVHDASGAWRVRVVRNRFPIVSSEPTPIAPPDGTGRELPGRGAHEVIVESREHEGDLATFAPEHAADVVRVYRDRLRALEALPDVRAVCVYRNRGRRAGSSQSHPHAQVTATTVLPPGIARRHAIAREHAERTGRSLLEDLASRELASGARVVAADEAFAVYCPFASHRAYETWVVPRVRTPSFGGLPDALLAPLAKTLGDALRRVAAVTRGAAYNVVVRTPPVDGWSDAGAAWHLEILPRTGGDAGFELGTGMDVVPVAPERAAEALRAARVSPGK